MPTEDSGEYIPLSEDTDVVRLRTNVSFLWHLLDEIARVANRSPGDELFRQVALMIADDRYARLDEEKGVLVVVPQRGGN